MVDAQDNERGGASAQEDQIRVNCLFWPPLRSNGFISGNAVIFSYSLDVNVTYHAPVLPDIHAGPNKAPYTRMLLAHFGFLDPTTDLRHSPLL